MLLLPISGSVLRIRLRHEVQGQVRQARDEVAQTGKEVHEAQVGVFQNQDNISQD